MNNDAKINKLLQTVEDKKKKLGTKPRHILETNGVFKYPSGDYFNINVTTSPLKFADALAFLLQWQGTYEEALKRLDVTESYEYLHDGYSVKSWETDFKNRLGAVEFDRKKKELSALKLQLDNLISKDGKTQIELDQIEDLLK